ncbi:MAG: hypothetical protein ACK58T_20985, partial [Phycisphaerae bacterium]
MYSKTWSYRFARVGVVASVFAAGSITPSMAYAQCQPQWKVGDQQGLPGANAQVQALGVGDPDGAGPLGDCLIATGQFTYIGDARTY